MVASVLIWNYYYVLHTILNKDLETHLKDCLK